MRITQLFLIEAYLPIPSPPQYSEQRVKISLYVKADTGYATMTLIDIIQLSLLDPRPWPERSNETGSVRPSFRLFLGFLGFGSLVFSETSHGVRGPYIAVCDSQNFLKKSSSGKNDQKWSKWPKNRVFGLFKKIKSLVLSEFVVK